MLSWTYIWNILPFTLIDVIWIVKFLTSNDVDGTHEITLKYEIDSKNPLIKKGDSPSDCLSMGILVLFFLIFETKRITDYISVFGMISPEIYLQAQTCVPLSCPDFY